MVWAGRRRQRPRARRDGDAGEAPRSGDARGLSGGAPRRGRQIPTNVVPVLGQLRSAARHLDRRLGEPGAVGSRRRRLVPLRPEPDVRRPVARRLPVVDPARHARAGPPCRRRHVRSPYIAPGASTSRSRSIGLGARRALALYVQASTPERQRRPHRACEGRVWARGGTSSSRSALSQLLLPPRRLTPPRAWVVAPDASQTHTLCGSQTHR